MIKHFTFLFVLLLAISALLTPVVYSGLQIFLGPDIWPFSRVYDRVVLLVLIILLVFKRKDFRLSELKQDFLFLKETQKFKKYTIALLIALIPVLLVLPIAVELNYLDWKDKDFSYYSYKFLKLIPTFLIVSFLEELVFRVFLFWTIAKRTGYLVAAIISSAFYAFVHFIAPVKTFLYESFDIFAGFHYYLVVLDRIFSFQLFSAVIILFLIGLFLCYLLYRSKSLFVVAGFHAGWIIAIKVAKITTSINAEGETGMLIERYFLLSLPFTWVALLITLVTVLVLIWKNYGFGKIINSKQ